MTEILKLDNVGRSYGEAPNVVHALHAVSLQVSAGEFLAVTGRSGSGKSTLLNLAGGLQEPTEGDVFVAGKRLNGQTPKQLAALRRAHIGVVFQHLNLLPLLSAAENVAMPLELDGKSTKAALKFADQALEEVGLGSHGKKFPDELSGGQQQRVAIARALVGDRRLLLADEPTGALDERTGDSIISLLADRAKAGAAVIMVTHETAHAARADRVVMLRDGQVSAMTELAGPELTRAEVWA